MTVALGSGGTLSATFVGKAGAKTALVFDVTGYFLPNSSGDTYLPVTPARVLDTRFHLGLTDPLTSGTSATFQVSGISVSLWRPWR